MSSHPLPLFPPDPGAPRADGDPGRQQHPAWRLPHPMPTTLLALFPGTTAPVQDEIAEAIVRHAPEAVVAGQLTEPPEGALWTLVIEMPAPIDGRVIVFAEPADPEGAAGLDAACAACRWVVGVELLLPPDHLLRSFEAAIRLAMAAAAGTPAVLDLASSTWHTRASLERWFADPGADPPEWILWTAHAMTREREPGSLSGPGDSAWVRTSGLWRCGAPELELLDVPTELAGAGVALVHAVAALLLEAQPPPGQPWTIGQELEVALVPWGDVAPLLDAATPGSLASRRLGPDATTTLSLDHPLGGVRAVICAPDPRGTYRKVWRWPEPALRAIADGRALLVRSAAETRRSRRVAQRTLPVLAEALRLIVAAPGAAERPRALVAAPFRAPGGAAKDGPLAPLAASAADAGGEHLWLELDRIDGGIGGATLHGRLVDGSATEPALAAGTPVVVAFAEVSDWEVTCRGAVVAPDESEGLLSAVRRWLG